MSEQATQTERRWYRLAAGMTLLYVGLVLGGTWLVQQPAASGPWLRGMVGLLTPLPMLALLWKGRRIMLGLDGVESSIYLRSTSAAFFVTAALSLTYGLLEAFAGLPRPSAFLTFLVAMGAWGVATAWLSWRLSS